MGLTQQRDDDSDTLAETLRAMARIVEDRHPERRCSILLLDEEGKRVSVGAGPSLSDEYNAAVEGLHIGPYVGSCGSATYWNKQVLVEDIQNEALWRDLKVHAAKAGVAACWSHPIISRFGRPLGALALYSPEPGAPTPLELSGLEMAAGMVGLAIERGRAERALRASEAAAQFQARLLAAVTDLVTSFVDDNDWGPAANRLVRAAGDLTNSETAFVGVLALNKLDALRDVTEVWSEQQRKSLYDEEIQSGTLSPRDFDPFLREIASSDEPIVSNAPRHDSRFAEWLPQCSPVRSILAAPIRVNGSVVATICVGNTVREYSPIHVNAMSVLCRAASVLLDAYRRNKRQAALEEHLRQAAKMEAIGVLAGGVAHNFNNMLASVEGNAEVALEMLSETTAVRSNLSEIVAASRKSNELCNQMLAYAGRGVTSVQVFDCNALIRELADLQKATLSKKATLEYRLSPTPLFIEADRAQMNQVVMNLVSNAADALGDGEGAIVIETTEKTHQRTEPDELHREESLKPGRYVRIKLSDIGCGMNAETQARIYDPFFTTKDTGRGLGLAAVSGIVRAHRGAISLKSEVGRGTTFAVLLPQSSAPATISESTQNTAVDRRRGKRTLVVDDEPAVREVHARILSQAGYEVMSASDGQEAVEIFERNGRSIDCVLLDLSMPRLNGVEALEAIREFHSDVRAVLTSGFTEQEVIDRYRAAGFSGIVQKPTPRSILLAKIEQAMAQ